jgi:Trk K+ transport system NAD-binding subunit
VIIPHGDTVLKAGNTLVVLLEGGSEEQVVSLCKAVEKEDQT